MVECQRPKNIWSGKDLIPFYYFILHGRCLFWKRETRAKSYIRIMCPTKKNSRDNGNGTNRKRNLSSIEWRIPDFSWTAVKVLTVADFFTPLDGSMDSFCSLPKEEKKFHPGKKRIGSDFHCYRVEWRYYMLILGKFKNSLLNETMSSTVCGCIHTQMLHGAFTHLHMNNNNRPAYKSVGSLPYPTIGKPGDFIFSGRLLL